MRNFPRLGRFFGIHIRIHYTWIIAIPLITLAIVTQFSTEYGTLLLRIVFGVSASILFFFAILLREFVLSLIAVTKGTVVRSLTLFAFGGLSQVDKETTMPAKELLLAAAGMLYNLIIAGVFFAIYSVLAQRGELVVDVLLQWLAFICLMLALFHLLPGFPLDGGKILRAILWRLWEDYDRATRIASWAGWGIGMLLTIAGISLLFLTHERFTGAFVVSVGLMLQNASTHSRRQVREVSSNIEQQDLNSLVDNR